MSGLRLPIKELLIEPKMDDHELSRRGLDALFRAEDRRRKQRRNRVVAPLLLVALVGSVGAGLALRSRDAGPLRVVDESGALASIEASRSPLAEPMEVAVGAAARTVRLSDGSRVVLDPGTRLDVLDNDGQRFELGLRRGVARFDVRPGGPRRWVIQTGPVTVEVVGTGFLVEHGPERVAVRVDHGVVLVRGHRVPGGVQRLTAGGSVEVDTRAEAPRGTAVEPRTPSPPAAAAPAPRPRSTPETAAMGVPSMPPAAATVPSPDLAAPSRPAAPPSSAVAAPRSAVRASDGPTRSPRTTAPSSASSPPPASTRAARDQAPRASVAPPSPAPEGARTPLDLDGEEPTTVAATPENFDALLARADAARRQGRTAESLELLDRAERLAGEGTRRAVVTFTRGRLLADRLGDQGRAAAAFALALEQGLPRALEEDAYARLVEARVRSGDRLGARAAAAAHQDRFPDGAMRDRIRRWLAQP